MVDFSIIAAAPIGFFFFGILSTLLVAISKAGFGGALGSLSLPLMLVVLSPGPALSVLLPIFLLCDFLGRFAGNRFFPHSFINNIGPKYSCTILYRSLDSIADYCCDRCTLSVFPIQRSAEDVISRNKR